MPWAGGIPIRNYERAFGVLEGEDFNQKCPGNFVAAAHCADTHQTRQNLLDMILLCPSHTAGTKLSVEVMPWKEGIRAQAVYHVSGPETILRRICPRIFWYAWNSCMRNCGEGDRPSRIKSWFFVEWALRVCLAVCQLAVGQRKV
jgi:hypothetical protein